MISKETIEELIEALREECQREVSFEKASNALRGAVKMFDLLAQIDYRDEPQTYHFWHCPILNAYIVSAMYITPSLDNSYRLEIHRNNIIRLV